MQFTGQPALHVARKWLPEVTPGVDCSRRYMTLVLDITGVGTPVPHREAKVLPDG